MLNLNYNKITKHELKFFLSETFSGLMEWVNPFIYAKQFLLNHKLSSLQLSQLRNVLQLRIEGKTEIINKLTLMKSRSSRDFVNEKISFKFLNYREST